jgi:transcriptional regulator with GAF, ATPase, and Fis domain
MKRFPDYMPPTKIEYLDGRPTELHLRRCRFTYESRGRRREKTFDQGVISLGAMADNDLVVNEETVSRYHCKVVQEPDGWVLVDLQSTNGTFINRVRIREAYLKSSCAIQLGKVDVKFAFADEKLPVVPSRKESLGPIVGRSLKMREMFGLVEKIAPTGTTVIIEGETGTGKEVVAQALHQLSLRAKGPMMVFDCGAVPGNLIESELFGHEKGSFTGAVMTRQGLFEMAHGGTLFLDEIGELGIELQPKLLRALEHREIRRVGGSRPSKVDVRVIAATNRTLEDEGKAGRFRQDLFYRLSVVRILLPPLRERTEDIPLLVDHFLRTLPFNRLPDGGLRAETVAPEAMDLLAAHRFPGNVRELLNIIERAVSLVKGGRIEAADLPELQVIAPIPEAAMVTPAASPPTGLAAMSTDGSFKEAKERFVATFERDYLASLLKKHQGNVSRAAREAEIDRKYFRKLMRKHELEPEPGLKEESGD